MVRLPESSHGPLVGSVLRGWAEGCRSILHLAGRIPVRLPASEGGIVSRLTFPMWLKIYGRTEDDRRVFAACECEETGYNPPGSCEGWVLTWRDSIYPHETPLTAAQREQWGVPDPHPEVTLVGVYGQAVS